MKNGTKRERKICDKPKKVHKQFEEQIKKK
jgi:hypothetical protein